MPSPISPQISPHTRQTILNALVTAASGSYATQAILDLARNLFGNEAVAKAAEERRIDEKICIESNGSSGEDQACISLARAYLELLKHGEKESAEECVKVATGHWVRSFWEECVTKVGSGG